jgi:hypothetical protein
VKPVLQALLLADHVYEDRGTRKKIVAGTFNTLGIVKLRNEQGGSPAAESKKPEKIVGGLQPGSPYAYISITEVHGSAELIMRYVDLQDNAILLQTGIKVQCNDPLETIEMIVALPPLPTPHVGVYALELLCGEEMMGAHRVRVIEVPEGSK